MLNSKNIMRIRYPLRFLLFFLLLAITSCTAPSGIAPDPPVAVPGAFSRTGTAVMPGKWWTALNDPVLDTLIETALADNFDLRSVWDRLDQSRAVARKSGADFTPGVDASAGFVQSANKEPGTDFVFSDSFSLGVSASYEIDLWGRVSSTHDAAVIDVLSSRENLHAAAISLSAEVASVWYKLVEVRGQSKLLDDQVGVQENYLDIVTTRFKQGQGSSADILQQRQSLEAKKEEELRVESSLKILEHQLAILLGKAPGTYAIPGGSELPALPALPDAGLPADLITRRPDTRSAFLAIQAADKRLAAAIADRYPKISLSAGINTSGTTASSAPRLFDNWLATLAGNLLMPVIDGDEREAEVDRTRALRSESISRYGQTILVALKEVEDALVREDLQLNRLESFEKQIKLSEKSMDIIRENYTHGTMDFLRLLTTLLNHHTLQRNMLAAQRELVEYRINLCRALGGGWEMRRVTETITHEDGVD